MRKALNENPVVQAAAIGVLALLVGVMLITRMGGGGAAEPAATTDPAAGAEATPSAASTAALGSEATPTAGAPATPPVAGSAPAPATGASEGFVAGPGLPKAVVSAYDSGDAIALLVVRDRGIDDRRLKAMVEAMRSRGDTAVFTTRAAGIAEYSRITQGVSVDRVPALVVIKPKRLADGPLPEASVVYGFRGPASVQQAVENALYKGPDDIPYYPK